LAKDTRPLIGDIAAQRLWGKGAAAQRAVDVLEGTFAQQRAFIEDPAKLKWALCTRRAAKSYSDERAAKREEHPNCANDLADAALYAWRLCYSYLSVAVDPPPKVGSPEWHAQEEEEMLQAEIRRYHERREAEADSWGMTVEEYDWATWKRT